MHRNLLSLRKPDDDRPLPPEPTLEEIAQEHVERPVETGRRSASWSACVCGTCFPTSMTWSRPTAAGSKPGSFRGSSGFLADILNRQTGREQYDYIRVCTWEPFGSRPRGLGPSLLIRFSAVSRPCSLDWVYHFSRLSAVDLWPLNELAGAAIIEGLKRVPRPRLPLPAKKHLHAKTNATDGRTTGFRFQHREGADFHGGNRVARRLYRLLPLSQVLGQKAARTAGIHHRAANLSGRHRPRPFLRVWNRRSRSPLAFAKIHRLRHKSGSPRNHSSLDSSASPAALRDAVRHLEEAAQPEILKSYLLEDGTSVATHYLWNGDELEKVWLVGRGAAGRRRELAPTAHDQSLSDSFAGYHSKLIRQPRFFTNSRINAAPEMNLDAVLTGRAQRNIDLLLQAIEHCPDSVRPALKLCLTAASGQMTQMVFAVTGRGKTTGISSQKTEVGSWVIGYWRPKLHFEVNAWNCFEKRTSTLLKAISCDGALNSSRLASSVSELVGGNADALLARGDCRSLLGTLPDECVQLVITDPPHSDRMPYLELSELWNSILGVDVDFSQEIVISNAKERGKTSDSYRESMMEFLSQVPASSKPGWRVGSAVQFA